MEAFALKRQWDDGTMYWGRDGFELWLRTDGWYKPTFFVSLLMDSQLQAVLPSTAPRKSILLPGIDTRSYTLAFYLFSWFVRRTQHTPDDSVAELWLKTCDKLQGRLEDRSSKRVADDLRRSHEIQTRRKERHEAGIR